MTKFYENIMHLMPNQVLKMSLLQYSEIQGEVSKLVSKRVEGTLNAIPIKMLTKPLTGISIKYKVTPKRNNEEIIEIFKRGKLKTLIRFKHDKSGTYSVNTHTIITNHK